MEKELLIKYVKGEVTGEEAEKVALWLEAGDSNMREFIGLHKVYDIAVWQKPRAFALRKATAVFDTRRIVLETLKIAAVLIMAFILYRWMDGKPEQVPSVMQTLHVPAGQRARLILADGSQVWLNANTTFTFPTRFTNGKREVNLNGEGYFDVAHNTQQPFVVNTDKYNVKVLGTEFNLLAYVGSNEFNVSLLGGAVEVLKPGAESGIKLEPGKQLFLKDNRLYSSAIEHMNYFLWKDGLICFDDEPFNEMVRKLELYFDLKIIVKNNRILDYRCTGKFRGKDGVEHILKVLQLSNRFKYTVDEKLNLITIE